MDHIGITESINNRVSRVLFLFHATSSKAFFVRGDILSNFFPLSPSKVSILFRAFEICNLHHVALTYQQLAITTSQFDWHYFIIKSVLLLRQ